MIFKFPWGYDEKFKTKEEYTNFITEKVKKEKPINGKEITKILDEKLSKRGYLLTHERNYISQNINPFDVVAGNKETLEIYGFEIKGDTDDTKRLMHQLDSYIFACSEVYVVFHKKKAPEWLPREIGVLRVSTDGDIFCEHHPWTKDALDISSVYEWDELFKLQGLGKCSSKTRQMLEVLESVRKNILFNRFFSNLNSYFPEENKIYPFSEKEKSVIIGLDIPYHYKKISTDLRKIEIRIAMLKSLINIGNKGIKDFITKEEP